MEPGRGDRYSEKTVVGRRGWMSMGRHLEVRMEDHQSESESRRNGEAEAHWSTHHGPREGHRRGVRDHDRDILPGAAWAL